MNPTITTYTGKTFWLVGGPNGPDAAPDLESIDIEDIAHGLSNYCRFTGQTSEFYSVAQHSLLASELVPKEHALAALLHDASEAYLGDVSTPLKALLPRYKEIESLIQAAIHQRFGLPETMHPSVHEADAILLATEARDLMASDGREYGAQPHPTLRIHPMQPGIAKAFFLKRFEELTS